MSNNNNSVKTNPMLMILSVIGIVIITFVLYCIWVNSHGFDGSFFGMVFQMPFESIEHYCSRKSDRILTVDTETYYECLSSRNDVHKKLVEKIKADRDRSIGIAASNVSDKAVECIADVTEEYYTTTEIENYIKTGVKLQPTANMNKQKLLNELETCIRK